MYLNVSAAMANVDPTLRERRRTSARPPWRVFRSVTLPLVSPGYFAGRSSCSSGVHGFGDAARVRIRARGGGANLRPGHGGRHESDGLRVGCGRVADDGGAFRGGRNGCSGNRRYEMMGRGHVAGAAEQKVTGWRAGLIMTGLLAVISVALLPHASVVLQSLSSRGSFRCYRRK